MNDIIKKLESEKIRLEGERQAVEADTLEQVIDLIKTYEASGIILSKLDI